MFTAAARSISSRMSTPVATAPFSRAVVDAMRKLSRRQRNSVLLTVDLTRAVADEAIRRKDSVIVAYRKSHSAYTQSLLRLAAEGISVYCPHTAIDCAQGGLGDWLADIVTGEATGPATAPSAGVRPKDAASRTDSLQTGQTKRPKYMLQHHPSQLSLTHTSFSLGAGKHKRHPITPTKVEGHNQGGGMGRIVRLSSPVPLTEIIDRIGLGLGVPKGFPIAVPQGKTPDEMQISSIGICAGSGGHLFSEAEKRGEEVDLYFTGELSHHEALAAIEKGKCVISLFHSNTERGFLHTVLKPQLEAAIGEEWGRIRTQEKGQGGVRGEFADCLDDEMVEVHVSEVDRDPYGIMVLDFERMHEWHTSFLKIMKPLPEGKAPIAMAKGDDMYLKFLQVGSKVKIVENSEHALTWEGGPALLFHGIHSLTFEPLDGGKATKFINGETFTGIFGQGAGLPGIKGNVSALYEGYNRDLKKRCEEETVAKL
nr:ngg1-interacting factor 3 [Quercus suber]